MSRRKNSIAATQDAEVYNDFVAENNAEMPEVKEEDDEQEIEFPPSKPRDFATDTRRTELGEEKDGIALTTWQQLVRLMISVVLPSNKYQKIHGKADRLNKEDFETSYVIDDYVKHYECKPPVIFIPLLTLIQVIIFICHATEIVGRMEPFSALTGVPFNSPFVYDNARRYEIWRFFTYMLVHQGCIHFIFNMCVQIYLGIPLELVHRWWRVALVYMLGVVAGAMMHSVADRRAFLAGASGGVYALIGAHCAVTIMNFKDVTYGWMHAVLKIVMSSAFRFTAWCIFVIIDTVLSIYTRHVKSATNDPVKVGYASHFMGLLVGIFIGYAILRSTKRRFWRDIFFYLTLIPYACLIIFTLFFNIFHKDYPHTDWRVCCIFMSI